MTWQAFVFVPVLLAAGGYAGFRFWILFKILEAHQGSGPRLDRIPERTATFFLNVLGQKAVLHKKFIGVLHALIFWGFVIISIGTLEQFTTTIHSTWHFYFIGAGAYQTLVFLEDLFTFLVLLSVLGAAYRRFITRPPHLGQSGDANRILLFTGGLMVSIFLMNGFEILADPSPYSASLPFSGFVSTLFAKMDFSHQTSGTLATFFKWIHMLLVLGFGIYIPGSKHLHIIAASPNTFLRSLDRQKSMTAINFEDESKTQYGAAKVTDLSWKDALDYYSCTECGRCQELCPAYNTEKPLSPKNLIIDLKQGLYKNKPAILANRPEDVTPVIDEAVTEEVIWGCTSCRACEIACPVFIEHTNKIYDIRRNLVMMESKFPPEVQAVFKNMETNGTPWAFSAQDRAKWADGLGITTMAEDSNVDVLFWVGCAGAFDDRNKKVARALASLMKKAGVKFSILGTEETCTGDSARRIGNEYLFQTLAKANVETLNRYQVKKIVTACPHCFNTLKNEYPAFGGNYEVEHHSQFIARMVAEGRLNPSQASAQKITFHDSCYLGRWNGVYKEPRKVLQSVTSAPLVEMEAHHDQSMCCGAGGGRMWMEEKIGKRINIARTEQALKTGAGVVALSCPFCMTMLNDGLKAKEKQDQVKVLDVAELMDQAT